MKASFWGYLIILLGVGIIVSLIVIYSFASTSENDYYLVKETMEAAMIDALIDDEYVCNGTLTMDKETFVESFIRRFSDMNNYSNTYTINFYNINETPPMASVEIKTVSSGNSATKSKQKYDVTNTVSDVPIVTRIDAILDTK